MNARTQPSTSHQRPGRNLALVAALAVAALGSSCASTKDALPPGAGLRAHDRTMPSGAVTYAQPNWMAGDELIFRRGDRIELRFVVREGTDGGFVLEDPIQGRAMVLDSTLAQLGERDVDDDEFDVSFDPFDPSYSWPLWVGKRWTGEYTLRTEDGDVPIVAHYHCDAVESVETPAGTFEALRIWRRDRVNAEGNYLERTSVEWFAPEVGYMVKRLEDGLSTVLVEFHTQASS
ncbi:hypothetical protein [Engelhardtia mirabilis]|uniref:DUF3108 domain-containing protein n=1 Tax=Engelhardtia mirabilis TaxID=2528011 RepID=A0A518BFS8_9BACT|nr:hypothetical protein Pla133_08880 [Planctomycetes bacterium Pla133]QDV00148.1 hypothetical protein Pla86_08870 [Planctomycetes bacterium Pla86]